MGRIPNEVELGSKPFTPPRYIWSVVGEMGSHCGFTWGGLKKALHRDPESTLYFCDLIKRRVIKELDEKDYILAAWRENYWEKSWDLEQDL